MAPPSRLSKEETRERILAAADTLFRQFGFGKTTIADIADSLGMSSANIYKFFASKDALVEASADRNLSIIRQEVTKAISSRKTVEARLEEAVLVVFRFHQDLFRNERQIFKMVAQAHEESWACMESYHEFLFETFRALLSEGIAAGRFAPIDQLDERATALVDSLFLALHPHVRHSWSPMEGPGRVIAHIKLVINALK